MAIWLVLLHETVFYRFKILHFKFHLAVSKFLTSFLVQIALRLHLSKQLLLVFADNHGVYCFFQRAVRQWLLSGLLLSKRYGTVVLRGVSTFSLSFVRYWFHNEKQNVCNNLKVLRS